MKNQINEVDAMIKSALSKEEAEYYDKLNEQGLFEMIGELYKGKLMWFNLVNVLLSFTVVGIGIYCLVQFLNTEETNELIRWGVAILVSALMASMLKIWAWNQLDKNALVREIKKLQLTLAAHMAEGK